MDVAAVLFVVLLGRLSRNLPTLPDSQAQSDVGSPAAPGLQLWRLARTAVASGRFPFNPRRMTHRPLRWDFAAR